MRAQKLMSSKCYQQVPNFNSNMFTVEGKKNVLKINFQRQGGNIFSLL